MQPNETQPLAPQQPAQANQGVSINDISPQPQSYPAPNVTPNQVFQPLQPQAPNGVDQTNMQDTSNPTPQPSVSPQVVIGSSPKKPKFLLVGIIGLVIIALLTIGAVFMTKTKKKPPVKQSTTQQQTQQSQSEGPQPAQSIDVEQSNNSINQDISGLNTDNDYPQTQLDDKALGL